MILDVSWYGRIEIRCTSVARYQNHIKDDPLIDNSGMYLMPKQRFLFSLE